jgi:hypothetical protein
LLLFGNPSKDTQRAREVPVVLLTAALAGESGGPPAWVVRTGKRERGKGDGERRGWVA